MTAPTKPPSMDVLRFWAAEWHSTAARAGLLAALDELERLRTLVTETHVCQESALRTRAERAEKLVDAVIVDRANIYLESVRVKTLLTAERDQAVKERDAARQGNAAHGKMDQKLTQKLLFERDTALAQVAAMRDAIKARLEFLDWANDVGNEDPPPMTWSQVDAMLRAALAGAPKENG